MLFQLWLLIFDNINQQLVFEAIWSHSEVDQGHLDANFRKIMRIWQLGCDQELELMRVWHPGVSKSKNPCSRLFDYVLLEDWL